MAYNQVLPLVDVLLNCLAHTIPAKSPAPINSFICTFVDVVFVVVVVLVGGGGAEATNKKTFNRG